MINALACLLCSGFYIDASIVVADAGIERFGIATNTHVIERDGVTETWRTQQLAYDRAGAQNPQVRVALGFEGRITARCSLYAEAWHQSSIATGRDHGRNAIAGGLRCRPWSAR